MKKILLISFVLINSCFAFCQTLTNEQIHRIGDYGKLWSVLKLFHPEFAYNNVNADSVFTKHIGLLLRNPSAKNFKTAVSEMLDELHDQSTIISSEITYKNDSVTIPKRTFIKWLPDSIVLIHFGADIIWQLNADNKSEFFKLLDTLRSAKAIIIDLRRATAIKDEEDYGETDFLKRLSGYLINYDIYYPSYRTRIHYGHESQTLDMSSFYKQGWVNANTSLLSKNKTNIAKPLCLIINKLNDNLAENIVALQQQGFAKVLADDSLGNFNAIKTYSMLLADSLNVQIRISETVYPNGCKNFIPDEIISHNNQSDEVLINNAIMLLHSQKQAPCTELLQNTFASQKTITNDSVWYPPSEERLWGLINYWSEINYFCPNKDRFQKNWDSVLYEYVPQFLGAKDSMAYNLAVAKLITEIHDSHGWFSSQLWDNFYLFSPQIQVKYIEGKTIVTKVSGDTLKKLFSVGDEIVKLDGKPVDAVRNWFAQYIGASNNASLQRDINDVLLGGGIGSIINITYKHNDVIKTSQVKRLVNRYTYLYASDSSIKPVWKKINTNIGYVDFGRLEIKQLDSMFNDLKNTKTIIIDNRSYPQGTIWSMVNYLTTKPLITGAEGITMIADNPNPSIETKQYRLWQIPVTPKMQYKGKLIILVNEETQSQAEYSCMVLQAAFKNTTIIGSQTAGADGDVTGIKFPGGISTAFSGHGVLYPDGRNTQGIGIVPDIKVSPTLKGIKEGRDEVLDRAIQFAETNK